MSRIRIVKGKVTKITGGNYNIWAKSINITAGGKIIQKGEQGVVYGNVVPPRPKSLIRSTYIKKAEWQNELGKPITRAVYEQTIYLDVEIDYENLKTWGNSEYSLEFELYHKSKENKLAYIPLYYFNSDKPYTEVIINAKGKARIKIKLLRKGFENYLKKQEDLLYNLFCECKIVKKDNLQIIEQRVDLPSDDRDYLKVGELVIDRYKMPGLNAEGNDIADDMTYGYGSNVNLPIYKDLHTYKEEYTEKGFDVNKHIEYANRTPYLKTLYTEEEIKNLGFLVSLTDKTENEDFLWYDFKAMSSLLSMGKLNDNILLMIAKMKENQGGIFENPDLTQAIIENPSTDDYCKEVEKYIIESIQKESSTLENVEDNEPYFFKFDGDDGIFFNSSSTRKNMKKYFDSPIYTWKKNSKILGFEVPLLNEDVINGETIALNDIWATEIILKELEIKEDEIKGKYEVTLWDHFGLDKPDLEKFYSYGAGFRAWFILQHRFGYRPFLTKITFEKEFSSKNLNN